MLACQIQGGRDAQQRQSRQVALLPDQAMEALARKMEASRPAKAAAAKAQQAALAAAVADAEDDDEDDEEDVRPLSPYAHVPNAASIFSPLLCVPHAASRADRAAG